MLKNDRKEKCNNTGYKHILKANLSQFYDMYLSSYTQEHLAQHFAYNRYSIIFGKMLNIFS